MLSDGAGYRPIIRTLAAPSQRGGLTRPVGNSMGSGTGDLSERQAGQQPAALRTYGHMGTGVAGACGCGGVVPLRLSLPPRPRFDRGGWRCCGGVSLACEIIQSPAGQQPSCSRTGLLFFALLPALAALRFSSFFSAVFRSRCTLAACSLLFLTSPPIIPGGPQIPFKSGAEGCHIPSRFPHPTSNNLGRQPQTRVRLKDAFCFF